MNYAALLVVAYLVGSIPSGLAVGRLLRGVDVRQFGSGRTGMTNVLRTLGWKAAALVLALDALKGVAAVLLARVLVGTPLAESLAILTAILGHVWPVFARFRGGRGIATAEGGLLTLAPWVGVLAMATFAPVLYFTRYVSLSSIVGVGTGAVALAVLALLGRVPAEYLLYAGPGAVLLIWGHRDNIRRLLQGRELRLGERAPPVARVQGGRP